MNEENSHNKKISRRDALKGLATVPVVEDIGDIHILVHGGAGPNSLFAPGAINHKAVSRKIE